MKEKEYENLLKFHTKEKVIISNANIYNEVGSLDYVSTKYNCPNCKKTLENDKRNLGIATLNSTKELGNYCRFCGKPLDWGFKPLPENVEVLFVGNLIKRIKNKEIEFDEYVYFKTDGNFIYEEMSKIDEVMKGSTPFLAMIKKI